MTLLGDKADRRCTRCDFTNLVINAASRTCSGTASLTLKRAYLAAKLNANYPKTARAMACQRYEAW
jgi:hypothetical protein